MNQIEEERLALNSIYDESILTCSEDGNEYSVRYDISTDNEEQRSRVLFKLVLPPTYPEKDPPIYELQEAFGQVKWIDSLTGYRSQLDKELRELFMPGDVVLFAWIEHARESLFNFWSEFCLHNPHLLQKERIDTQRDVEITKEPEVAVDTLQEANVEVKPVSDIEIYHSDEPIVDRKSVFVAHLAKVQSFEEVKQVMDILLLNPKIRRATHNIMAYRIDSDSFKGQDFDDDGETAAGGRLLKLLELCKCKNVVVVVSRWYGGVQLGPDRFKHINNVARNLLLKRGFIN